MLPGPWCALWELLFVSTLVTFSCELHVLVAVTGSWTCWFLDMLLGTTYVCHFFLFFFVPFSFLFLLGFVSWLQESCVLSKTALGVKGACFCKAIWTGSLQIPGAPAWLPACPCRAPVPEMDLSPFPPSALLARLPVPGVSREALIPGEFLVFISDLTDGTCSFSS